MTREVNLAAAPVPVSTTVCGVLFALVLKLSVPVREPMALGEKTTEAVHFDFAASVFGLKGQLEVKEKSLVLLVIVAMLRAED